MKKMIFILLFAVMVSACVPAVAPTPTPIPPTAVPTQDPKALAAEIDALVKENYQKGVYDGSVLVARDGQVILSQGYGFADREKKIPNTCNVESASSHRILLKKSIPDYTLPPIILVRSKGWTSN